MAGLRLAFLGTPAFSVPTLAALLAAGHEVVAVYSQPPRPAGRGQKEQPSPVESFARRHGIEVRTPVGVRGAEAARDFAALRLDAAVVVAYGLILPTALLEAPRLGCLNVHASLLPRWRGAAPIQRAIEAGDDETGITIMRMDAGLDTGAMLLVEKTVIAPDDTGGSLHDRLSAMGGPLIIAALAGLDAGRLVAIPQPAEGVTYAPKIGRGDLVIDWTRPTLDILRRIRAFAPRPGAHAGFAGERFKILGAEAEFTNGVARPGTLLDDRLLVATGDGALRIKILQRPGKGPLDAETFLRGAKMPSGAAFED